MQKKKKQEKIVYFSLDRIDYNAIVEIRFIEKSGTRASVPEEVKLCRERKNKKK